MPDPTPQEVAARANADKAAADKAAADKARQDDVTSKMVETMARLERRTAPLGPAAATPGLDVTQPGGMYKVGGKLVNAHGRELNDDGSIMHPEQLRVNEFGQMV